MLLLNVLQGADTGGFILIQGMRMYMWWDLRGLKLKSVLVWTKAVLINIMNLSLSVKDFRSLEKEVNFTVSEDAILSVRAKLQHGNARMEDSAEEDPTSNLTFNLRLSEEEQKAKERVALPFVFSQEKKSSLLRPTPGSGKIVYEPDANDDFDEEDPDDDLDWCKPHLSDCGVMVDMLKTRQCLLGVRTFLGVTSRIWSFFLYILRKHIRTIIQYQTVRYDILPLSPVSRNRLNTVKRKILVLDLDETLIHSHHDGVLRPTVRPGTPPDFILKVVIDKHPVRFFVHKRPHVDFFLEVVSQWYELVVFTASMEIYGSAVADKLDNNKGILKRRYYRQHCTLDTGSYVKDLSVVHEDLSSVVILDNSPGAYRSHPDNAIPIKSWFSDPSDTSLLNLLPMLDALRFTADVRSVLSRNLHQHRLW
ncbi:hypothetical protein DNTS_009639 [Danionella cerebrum]|uniref:protein-serine/threonine phosphatase n=1 Tax=Danionella cerebrum TaxID=2873325 RepID=A0A553R4Q7_9TELE|nr:hypothetical protein DNTS_009639 [Danionella translucida]